jgi:DNA-directed RNA polymerase I subunit RPA1
LLTSFSKLFTAFLQRQGFSLGVEDILVVKDAEEQRTHFITHARKVSALGLIMEVEMEQEIDLCEFTCCLVFLWQLKRLLWALWGK